MKQIQIIKTGKKYIIGSVVALMLLGGCSDTKDEGKSLVQENTKTQSAPAVVPEVEKLVEEKVAEVLEASEEVSATVEEVVAQTVESVTQSVESTKEAISEAIQPSQTETTVALDGAKLYTKCIACHGANGEKVALGKSKIIKDMSKEDFIIAMKGYQDGTYGGAMKGVMASQVKGLSEDEIRAIADYIVK